MGKTEKLILIVTMAVFAMLTPLYKYITAKIIFGIMFTVFALITTFLYWLISGRKRSFEVELVSEENRSRNEFFGMLFILLVVVLVIYINNR